MDFQNLADSTEAALDAYETWTPWTPIFAVGPTGIGSGGVAEGAYMLIGDLFIGSFRLELGTSPTVSGSFELNLPVSAYVWSGGHMAAGNWYARDNSDAIYHAGTISITATSPSRVMFSGVDAGVISASHRISDSSPFNWTTGDILTGQLTYRTT